MKPLPKKIILRYLKEDLDKMNKSGRFYIDTSFNPNQYLCEEAMIESDNEELNEQGFHKDDRVLVQYLIAWDEEDNQGRVPRNQYFIQKEENGDILRWANVQQIYGKMSSDGFVPMKGFVFCNIPPKLEIKSKAGLILDEQPQDTTTKGFHTTVKYIHPHDSEETGLKAGDKIYADKNSDAVKKVFGQELIRVPKERILALCPT